MTVDVEELRDRLTAWLRARLGDVAIGELQRPSFGNSNVTVVFDANEARYVLRMQSDKNQIFDDPDVLREGRVLMGLDGTAVPHPAVRWVERDSSLLGAPFFVMDYVDGRPAMGRPSFHADGWIFALDPLSQRTIWENGLVAMAAVHKVNWDIAHRFLAEKGTTLADHVGRMERLFRWAAAGRSFPVHEAALAALNERLASVRCGEPGLLWGDSRLGNMLVGDDLVVKAVIDWELAGIGPAEIDLGWWLMMDDFLTTASDVERLPGFPDRLDTVTRYGDLLARPIVDIDYFVLLATFTMAITVIRITDIQIANGELAPDTRMAYGNIPTQMLARQLGIEVPDLAPEFIARRGLKK